jgi:hypothetical protein
MTCSLCAGGYPRILGRHINATEGLHVADLGPCEDPDAPEPCTPDARAIAASAKLHEKALAIEAAAALTTARVRSHMEHSQPREPGEDRDD